MLEEYKTKEIARCNKVIESYQEDINVLEQEVQALEEKYKKVFEEMAEYKEIIDMYKESQAQWERKKKILSGEEVIEEEPVEEAPKRTRKKREKKEEVPAPPKDATEVVDTIYPENNESEEETTEELPQEDLPVFEETGASSGSLFDFTEEPSAVPEETPVETVEEEGWGEPKDTVEEKEPINLDDWTLPEEWKN